MAIKNFEFNPKDGFLDNSFYEETPANARETLQRQHNQTKECINSLINTLNNKELGESGSENISSAPIEGIVGENVYDQIKDCHRQIKNVAIEAVPDASIINQKLANNSVTKDKIKSGEIETSHFSENAIAPKAQDVVCINGKAAESFFSAEESLPLGMITSLVCPKQFTSVNGVTKGNIRYFSDMKGVYKLNLDTGEHEEIYSGYKCDVIFLDKDENLYELDSNLVTSPSGSTQRKMSNIYKFENKQKVKLAEFDISYKSYSTEKDLGVIPIPGLENQFYYFSYYDTRYSYNIKIYKLILGEIVTLELVSQVAIDERIEFGSGNYAFIKDDIIFCGFNKIENLQIAENIKFCVSGYSNKGLLVVSPPNTILIDSTTLLPKCASLNMFYRNIQNTFIKDDHLYYLIDGYIYKQRIR